MPTTKTVIIQGDIKRESSVAGGFAHERHFAVELPGGGSPRLASYRTAQDEAPSKVWKLTNGTTVGPVSKRSFKIRGNSLLYAIASGDYQLQDLVRPANQ